MTYEVIILGHLHMPLYFIGTFTEYPFAVVIRERPFPVENDLKLQGTRCSINRNENGRCV